MLLLTIRRDRFVVTSEIVIVSLFVFRGVMPISYCCLLSKIFQAFLAAKTILIWVITENSNIFSLSQNEEYLVERFRLLL